MNWQNKNQLALLTLLLAPAAASAQTVIYDVVNYGSRTGSGLPSAGIAQGALFAVTGANLGPAAPVQAGFPLPTGAGLGGVTISVVASDRSNVNAIMVYVNTNEVDAILPSSTPLGSATLTVNNNGTTASFPFNVVANAFGIFTGAGVYNVNPDGSTTPNTLAQSAQPGQTILINGTGLGALAGVDETQSGVTATPNATITVWVGTVQATVVSAGPGTCCAGIDPNFPIPQGIAAWDVIAITIPAGVQGCQVAVSIQSGNIVSNAVFVAIGPNGGVCPEVLLTSNGSPVTVSGPLKTAVINMTRSAGVQSIGGASVSSLTDSATAVFVPIDAGPNPVPLPSYPADIRASVGSCFVTVGRFDRSIPIVPPTTTTPPTPQVFLDAGPQLNITAPNVTEAMTSQQTGIYNATTIASTFTIPGLPPQTTTSGPDYLVPGPYTLDNGGGGADIGPFSGTLINPTPVNWTNMPAPGGTVQTSQGITLTWTGGDPGGVVVIVGSSIALQGTVSYSGLFGCYAFASDGQYTVPAFITQQLPPTGPAPSGIGILQIQAIIGNLTTTFPGIDLLTYFSIQAVGDSVVYQ